MTVIDDPGHLRAICRGWRREGRTIGFAPTMGNLHAGHRSLLAQAAADCDAAVASIFVNPLQFGPSEDLAGYPRTLADDLAMAEEEGVELVFTPTEATMYPPGFATQVEVPALSTMLCGRSRPTHFRGVATVVARLLGLTLPDRAYFGEKDFQQRVLIRRMVEDLGLGTEIVPMPIVREPDGLAMSSRNRYLNVEQRRAATVLFRALRAAEGQADPVAAARRVLEAEPLAEIDYVELVDPETLESMPELDRPGRLCLAVRIGPARLIDNAALTPRPPSLGGKGESQS